VRLEARFEQRGQPATEKALFSKDEQPSEAQRRPYLVPSTRGAAERHPARSDYMSVPV
jgi:hypothetical protein